MKTPEILKRVGNKYAPPIKRDGLEEATNILILERRMDKRLEGEDLDLNFIDDDEVIKSASHTLARQIPYMRGGDPDAEYSREQMGAYSTVLHIYEWLKDGLLTKTEIHRHLKDGKIDNCGSVLQIREYPAKEIFATVGGEVIRTEGKIEDFYCPRCKTIVQKDAIETEIIAQPKSAAASEILDATKRIVAWATRKIFTIAWNSEDLESRPIALNKMFPDFGTNSGTGSDLMQMFVTASQGKTQNPAPTTAGGAQQ